MTNSSLYTILALAGVVLFLACTVLLALGVEAIEREIVAEFADALYEGGPVL